MTEERTARMDVMWTEAASRKKDIQMLRDEIERLRAEIEGLRQELELDRAALATLQRR